MGEWGVRLRAVCALDGALRRVDGALALMRERYAESLPIEALAAAAHMSPSALYAHFREVTGLCRRCSSRSVCDCGRRAA